MNVLVVTHNVPTLTSGYGKRNGYLLRALCAAHHVTLLVIADDPAEAARDIEPYTASLAASQIVVAPRLNKRVLQVASIALRQPSITLRFSPPALKQALKYQLARERFDAVIFQSVIVADHGLPADQFIVIDEHNIEFELLERSAEQAPSLARRIHYTLEAATLKRTELRLLSRANLVTITSDREREELRRLIPGAEVVTVPNGVDTTAFAPMANRPEIAGRVLFTGTMDYHPNEQAAQYFAGAIWPGIRAQVPDATWYVVGANPPASVTRLGDMPGVTVTGGVPETQPYFADAAVTVAPLLVGGGTRLKILEALAMEKAVVTTSLGCEGLDVTNGKHLVIEDESEAFAAATARLLNDPAERRRLGAAGRALVERRYSWAQSGRELVDALERGVASQEETEDRYGAMAGG